MHRALWILALTLLLVVAPILLLSQRAQVWPRPKTPPPPKADFLDLLPVPGGWVRLGTRAEELLAVGQRFYPDDPRKRTLMLRSMASELGEKEERVEPFLLQRHLVTNEQYRRFVQETGHRFPFHWWRQGREDDWKKRRDEIREEWPGSPDDLLYWERHWQQLPHAIPEGTEQHPVSFVSWTDAQAFAGWAGMRLPTEAEWVLAAAGSSDREYVWGDEWTPEMLDRLRLPRERDQGRLIAVGLLGEVARGPFGHEDMVGYVWEWARPVGYIPVAARPSFEGELQKLMQSTPLEIEPPSWLADQSRRGRRWLEYRVLKGGSYFSGANPPELRIRTRAHAPADQTVEGIGFRVAMSLPRVGAR